MREMFKLRGTWLLLLAFICLKSNANNCEQFVSVNDYSCQGTFTARSHDEINDYLDGLSPDKKTYKNLYINFEESHKCSEHKKRSKKCKGFSRKGNNRPFSVSGLKITAPCSIIIAKNSKLQLKGDSCLSSNTEIFFGKNSHVVFDSLFINGHRKVQLEENINLIGRTFNSYSNGESSQFTVGKNSKILVNELK